MVDELVAYLVHELRTPLTVMLGYASLLEDAGTANLEWVQALMRSATDLDRRLSTLADVRRAGHGALDLDLETVDVAELVQTVVSDVEAQLAPHPVEVRAVEAAHCRGDWSRLRQAVMNLLTNAAKFSDATEPIDVEVRRENGCVDVVVRDRGPGVPPARRPELFRRFARLGSRHKGMGVGLYLVQSIARAHGGEARYEDADGGGARFSIRVPALETSR